MNSVSDAAYASFGEAWKVGFINGVAGQAYSAPYEALKLKGK